MANLFNKPRRFPDCEHIPSPPPPPGRPAQRAFVPQIRTFKDNEVPGGPYFLEEAVNKFSIEQHALTGQTPILKPFPGGCTVIYWIPAEQQVATGPVEKITGWWPERFGDRHFREGTISREQAERIIPPELKGPPPGHDIGPDIKYD